MVTARTICCNVNSAVCHTALFICFVQFSSNTAIISLSLNQWFAFLMVTDCFPWSRNSRTILDKRQSSNGLSLFISIIYNVIMQAQFSVGPHNVATVGYLISFRFALTRPLNPSLQYGDDEARWHKRSQPTAILSSSLARTQPLSRTKLSSGRVKKGSDRHSKVTTISLCNLNTAGNVVIVLLHSLSTVEPNLKTPCRTGTIVILW